MRALVMASIAIVLLVRWNVEPFSFRELPQRTSFSTVEISYGWPFTFRREYQNATSWSAHYGESRVIAFDRLLLITNVIIGGLMSVFVVWWGWAVGGRGAFGQYSLRCLLLMPILVGLAIIVLRTPPPIVDGFLLIALVAAGVPARGRMMVGVVCVALLLVIALLSVWLQARPSGP
jgi:hypothetical protein